MGYAGRYVCWGPPGTGKTTRLKRSVEKIIQQRKPGRLAAIVCTMTRSAAAEVHARNTGLPRQAIGTIHSHAYRAIGTPELVNKRIKDWNERFPEFEMASSSNVDDDQSTPGGMGEKLLASYDLHRARKTNWRTSSSNLLPEFVDAWEQWKTDNGLIDFTDMISLAIESAETAPGEPQFILVDESQDVSALEFELLEQWERNADGLIIFGDPYQALYVWRGANPDIFMQTNESTNVRVLDKSYRIPARVHETAMRWIKKLSNYKPIEYNPKKEPGEIAYSNATYKRPAEMIGEILRELDNDQTTIMVCASCAYMMTSIVKMLREEAIPFANPWRTKRADWNPCWQGKGVSSMRRVASFLSPILRASGGIDDDFAFGANETPVGWTQRELADFTDMIKAADSMKHGAKSVIKNNGQFESSSTTLVDDDALTLFQDVDFMRRMNAGEVGTAEAIKWLEPKIDAKRLRTTAFALRLAGKHGVQSLQKTPRVFVGTIHSFKGAEADVVMVFPDLSRIAFQDWIFGGRNRDSIIRMFYVAMTRAKRKLVFCQPSSSMAATF